MMSGELTPVNGQVLVKKRVFAGDAVKLSGDTHIDCGGMLGHARLSRT
jgi:hypothetical protein